MDLITPGSRGGAIRPNRIILITIAFLGLVLFYLTSAIYLKAHIGADSPGCRIVYMGPSYARIKAFDESHTKYATKYSLYLYREQNKDPIPNESDGGRDTDLLNGIPILFIPGNAGSYRQVRSIAAETANLYFDQQHANINARNFDFFTADFNEDFTAFHGRTILDQAEYLNQAIKFILQLYEHTVNPPKSVIILGHSMGGVVARVMVTLPNYVPESINTIITLASPHAAAPLTFDGDILKIYSAIDRFWLAGYSEGDQQGRKLDNSDHALTSIARERLANTSLISITGGLLDTVLPADYTTLGYLVPPTNGFTVYTTGIPNVWTPIDHLAIVWCSQLRRKVSETLLAIADYESPYKTHSLQKRMSTMKKILLSGFESYLDSDVVSGHSQQNEFSLKLDLQQTNSIKQGSDKVLKFTPGHKNEFFHLFHLQPHTESKFSLLSSIEFNSWHKFQSEPSNNPSILLCKNNHQNSGKRGDSEILERDQQGLVFDYTTEATQEYLALECIDASQDTRPVPKSNSDVNHLSDSSLGGDHQPYTSLQYDQQVLQKYDIIMIGESSGDDDAINEKDFVIGELSDYKSTDYTMASSLFSLFTTGNDISLSANRPLSVNVQIPGAWSSLLAYRVNIKHHEGGREGSDTSLAVEGDSQSNDPNESTNNFHAFIRQWSIEPFETKWHINVIGQAKRSLVMTMHGIAPFTPFSTNVKHNLNLEIWSDPSERRDGELPLDITVSIDYLTSLRLLVLRYRIAAVTFGLVINLVVFLIQFIKFNQSQGRRWIGYVSALQMVCKPPALLVIVTVLGGLSHLVHNKYVAVFLNMIDPVVIQDPNEINVSLHRQFKLNSFYLGLEETGTLWFIGIMFYMMSVGVNLVLYHFVVGLSFVFGKVGSAISHRSGWWHKKNYQAYRSAEGINPILGDDDSEKLNAAVTLQKQSLPSPVDLKIKRRVIGTIITIMLISLYLPFQFGYLISIVVQVISIISLRVSKFDWVQYPTKYPHSTTEQSTPATPPHSSMSSVSSSSPAVIQSYDKRDSTKQQQFESYFNYQTSLFMIMLWVLPINIPILIVSIHNFTVSWSTPFSSHHNFLAIVPILIMVERNSFYGGQILPRGYHDKGSRKAESDDEVSVNNDRAVASWRRWVNSDKLTYVILAYYIAYCLIYGVRHTFWLHHLLNCLSCWLLILYWGGW